MSEGMVEALNSMLIIRIIMKVQCAGLAGYLAYVANKIPNTVKTDQEALKLVSPDANLTANGLVNASKMMFPLAAALVVNFLFMAVFIVLKWHHPSQSNPTGFVQKFRPILLVLLGGQFFVLSQVVAGVATYFVGYKEYSLGSGVTGLDAIKLVANAGLSIRLAANSDRMMFIVLGWGWVMMCLCSFFLDFFSFMLYKRECRRRGSNDSAMYSISDGKIDV